MDTLTVDHLIAEWKKEESQPFLGWDFSRLIGRCKFQTPSWSYDKIARDLITDSHSLLDIGTGGGERLATFKDILPTRTTATEGHLPNVRLAQERLEPLGVKVIEANDGLEAKLPFESGIFDLVIDRHTAFNISEVERILMPNGRFLTEQVDGNNLCDLSEAFNCEQPWPFFTLDYVLEKSGFTQLEMESAREWKGKAIFKDVSAVVYYLKAVPWTVPNFSVEKYRHDLLSLHARLELEGELSFHQKLFLVRLRKPPAAMSS